MAVILLLSIVQSILGVGILLFGTPTLLLMGYSYHETLYLILPSSMLISILQSTNSRKLLVGTKYIYIYTLPMVAIGLFLVTYLYDSINIKYIVGSMLLLIGIIRSVPMISKYLKDVIVKNRIFYHLVMGGVHGVSNMGGGMLVILMSTVHGERRVALPNIAYTYLLFGIIQMIMLYMFSQVTISMDSVILATISLTVYMLLTKYLASMISDSCFNTLTTSLIFIYGILSFFKIG